VSNVTLTNAQSISGWLAATVPNVYPMGAAIFWNSSGNVIAGNTFYDQGSSLALYGGTNNTIWGNTFLNASVATGDLSSIFQQPWNVTGIFEAESGDLIYNNYVATSITAYAPDENIFFGFPQLNLESWNLPMVEPRHFGTEFNGYWLSGTIVPSRWQGGNYWADYVAGTTSLPYDEYGYIQSGGDYFPLPIVAHTVVFELSGQGFATVWSVTLNGVTQTSYVPFLVFYETPGTYTYAATLVHGHGTITPASGTIEVVHSKLLIVLHHT